MTITKAKLVTAKDIAATLGIHEKTVLLWCKNGRIAQPIRYGYHTLRWPASYLDELTAQKDTTR